LLLLAFILAALVVQDRLLWPSEPEYLGRPLSAWLRDLTAPDPAVNQPARQAVLAMGTNALPALERHLRARDSWLGQWVTAAQGRLPHRLWVLAMQTTRARNALERRWQAAVALSVLGPAAAPALPALVRALEDPEPRVVTHAAEALFLIGPPAWPGLVGALRSTNDHTFYTAGYALRRAGAALSNQAPALVEVFLETSAPRRETLTPLLAALGESAVAALGQRLADTNAARVEQVATALRQMIAREFGALRGVAALMNHPDARVRAGAARVLGGEALWPRSSINALIQALGDPEASVRTAAAEALAEAAQWTDWVTNALPALRRLTESAEPAARETFRRALSRVEARAEPSTP
jgi:HEAT repeat protein